MNILHRLFMLILLSVPLCVNANYQLKMFAQTHNPPLIESGDKTVTGFFNEGLRLYFSSDFHGAVEQFEAAQIFLHRKHGVLSGEQLVAIDWLISCHLKLNQLENVSILQRHYQRVVIAEYGEISPEALHTSIRIAKWNRATNNFNDAMFDYEHALDIMNKLAVYTPSDEAIGLGVSKYSTNPEQLSRMLSRQADNMSVMLFTSNS